MPAPNRRPDKSLYKDQYGAQQLGAGGDVLDIGAAVDRSVQLAEGTWRLSGTADVWFRQGTVTVVAATETAGSAFLGAGAIDTICVDDTTANGYVAVIYNGIDLGKLGVTKQ